MKWITCLNEDTPLYSIYEQLIKVAVVSCKKWTDLEPVFVYDGTPNELTRWMKNQNVHVLFHQSSLKQEIESISEQEQNPFLKEVGCGAFLRVDLPELIKKLGWNDDYVFYTDCDVMFVGDVTDYFDFNTCKLLLVAPENDSKEIVIINTGSMLMNIQNLYACNKEFKKFIVENLLDLLTSAWDQTAYINYFDKRWTYLSPLINWKPYWGYNENAKLIHFHGLKPHHRESIRMGKIENSFTRLVCDDFYKYCNIYDEYNRLHT